jgi:sialic acid synthase SpsE
MRIGRREITRDAPPYVIAELGVNHDGSVERAMDLVRLAAAGGASAIKLQLFDADRLLSRASVLATYQAAAGESDPFDMLRRLQLTAPQMRPVIEQAHAHELEAIVTVFSVELVHEAERLSIDAFKTASPDIINRPLIERLMSTGKPLFLSTGAATIDEVREATGWLGVHPHVLMQCVSAYPAPDETASLAARHALSDINPNALGYSDHTTSIDTGALAVASGASVLEKHLTHDRSATGPDHAASLDGPGFAEYVRLVHRAWRMLGRREKSVLPIEADVRRLSRQSLTSARPIAAGHVITPADIAIKRPGVGLPPSLFHDIVGRRTVRSIDADMPIVEDDLA